MAQQPLEGQGLLIIECSRSHSSRHTTLGRNPLDKSSARSKDLHLATHNTHKTRHQCPGGIRTVNRSKRTAADPHLRPRHPNNIK